MPKLNERQRKFISAYLQKPIAGEAAIAAGYSPKTARAIGNELMAKPHVKAELARRSGKALAVADTSVERICSQLAKIGFTDRTLVFQTGADGKLELRPLAEWPGEIRACIAGIETTRRHIGIKAVEGDEPGEESLVNEAEIVTKVRFHSAVEALKLLALYRRMFGADTLPADQRAQFVGMQIVVAPGAQLTVQQQINEKGK